MRRLQALRSLSFCTRAIAELELIDEPTAYDLQLLARYRAAAARLAREVCLARAAAAELRGAS